MPLSYTLEMVKMIDFKFLIFHRNLKISDRYQISCSLRYSDTTQRPSLGAVAQTDLVGMWLHICCPCGLGFLIYKRGCCLPRSKR